MVIVLCACALLAQTSAPPKGTAPSYAKIAQGVYAGSDSRQSFTLYRNSSGYKVEGEYTSQGASLPFTLTLSTDWHVLTYREGAGNELRSCSIKAEALTCSDAGGEPESERFPGLHELMVTPITWSLAGLASSASAGGLPRLVKTVSVEPELEQAEASIKYAGQENIPVLDRTVAADKYQIAWQGGYTIDVWTVKPGLVVKVSGNQPGHDLALVEFHDLARFARSLQKPAP